ncbi:MAG: NAD(P)/FAD-dependent oxidoreductase [Gemmatimonadaceae bacterium]|nr:NAD(P)/FAD-dependent oxidoreductase [Gemmatimonadaceae bacterium]
MTHELRDLTIIGAGPTGLYALFYAGMRGISAQVIDALPQVGGQLAALYPEKMIFDVAGFPHVLAKTLVGGLHDQAAQFGSPLHLNRTVIGLDEVDGHFVLRTTDGDFPTRSVVIAGGIGAFAPRKLPQVATHAWYGRGIDDSVQDPARYTNKRVVIVGGGDSAFDWAQQLRPRALHVTLVHRSDRFRAHQATVDDVLAAAARGDATEVVTFHEIHDVVSSGGEVLTGVVLRGTKDKVLREIQADVVLPMLGFVSDIGALAQWGLNCTKDELCVTPQMETGRAGIYAAGDITTYPGKLKLISVGFGEAATAVNQAVHWIYPEKKVNPGHSSNLAIFGQTAD